MAVDPFYARTSTTTPAPRINLEEFARSKISEVLRRQSLDRTNYQEPDDTCDCSDFITTTPQPPRTPRRRTPGLPPRPPRPPILPPPLPPPPARFQAPQLPSPVPPFGVPPSLSFINPNIGGLETDVPGEEDDGIGGETGPTGDVIITTEVPSNQGGGGLWGFQSPCCKSALDEYTLTVTDRELSLGVEESTHSGEFRNGCYPMCAFGDEFPERTSAGFCDRNGGIQICLCFARNNPSNPCYKGNGQVSPPGLNLTTLSIFKKIILPIQYSSPSEYYAENIVST
jgi:hypothetical protein